MEKQNINTNTGVFEKQQEGSIIPFAKDAYAQTADRDPICKDGPLVPNAYLIKEKYVSSCKPFYSGPLGLGSLFNNSIEYCHSNHVLPRNERVRYLQSWETGLRKYRYSQIEYQVDGKICTGWVSDGRKSVRHVIQD